MKYYLQIDNKKMYLTPDGVDTPEDKILKLSFYNNALFNFNDISKMFSNLKEIIVYMCIIQDDGTETDEMVSNVFTEYTKMKGINYDIDRDSWQVIMTIPDETQERLKALEEAKPALISAFTENAEPTGVASRYYEKDELIAIYDENDQPITVKAIQPISYKHPLIIGLNCEKYYGGNE